LKQEFEATAKSLKQEFEARLAAIDSRLAEIETEEKETSDTSTGRECIIEINNL
jgi:hypothetical protein